MQDSIKPTRREFLWGHKAHAESENSAALAPHSVSDETNRLIGDVLFDPATDPYVVSIGRRAMACQFQIYLNAGEYEDVTKVALDALDGIDTVESQLTVFRDDSEISRLNLTAYESPAQVNDDLFGLLAQANRLHRATSGAFDITAGGLSDLWSAAHRKGVLPDALQIESALSAVGSQHLELDEEHQTARFARQGVQINLGGIGKGYALDRAAELLYEANVENFLIHGGQSSVLARGHRVTSGGIPSGWTVGLIHPSRPQLRIAEIDMKDRALSTSGSLTKSIYHQGRRYGHILDPRSGQPAEGVLSATVVADTAAEADALSTAMFVLGPKGTHDFCEQNPNVGVILVLPSARAGMVTVESYNFADSDWRIIDG